MGMNEDLFDKTLLGFIAIQAVVVAIMAILHAFGVGAPTPAVPETMLRQCLCSCDE